MHRMWPIHYTASNQKRTLASVFASTGIRIAHRGALVVLYGFLDTNCKYPGMTRKRNVPVCPADAHVL